MSKLALITAAACLAAPLAAQTTQHHVVLDQPNNVISWDVSTSIGSVNVSPNTFRIGGTVELLLDSSSAPFTSGRLNGALAFTNPSTLTGEIPNPIPFLPPLATFDLKDMEFHLTSPTFLIGAGGNFTADITLTTTAGTNTMGGLFGSGTEPIAGILSPPTAVTGTVTQSGSTITFSLDMDITVTLVDPGTGVSSDINFDGPLDGFADSGNAGDFHLDTALPLNVGSNTLGFTGATPGAVYLAGTVAGLGSTAIPSLGVTLGINGPQLAGTSTADALGNGSFNLGVPGSMVGRSVWLQAVVNGDASNVIGTWIE